MTTAQAEGLKRGLEATINDLNKWGNMINPASKPWHLFLEAVTELLDYKAAYGENPRIRIQNKPGGP